MTEPIPERPPRPGRAERLGDVAEVVALVLLCLAGFAAPTDWNITIGLALVGLALVAVSFFASDPTEES